METRPFGRLGPVSALALGGGGTGQVWGATTRDEAVATVREAIASGITLLDVAPGYGDGEAERVVGEAFAGRLPAGVRLLTKCRLGAPPAADVFGLLAASLDASCERLRTDRVDLFVLHNQLVPDGSATIGTPLTLYREAVRPAFERLVAAGRIAAWGITAIGVPDTLLEAFADDPPPAVAQCVTNLLDSPGSMQRFDGPARPRELIAAAARRGIGVMGIRAVQAGALTDGFDRELPADHRDVIDYRRAEPFRALARELGASPAALAHRYALTMPGVSTVVLGVKNRAELRECIAAETRGPLDAATVVRIDAAARAGGAPPA